MILAATGLTSEAKAIRREGVEVIACGGHADSLRRRLETAIAARRPTGLISIGLAGGLDPTLGIADIVIGTHVAGHTADPAWTASLAAANPGARLGRVAAVASPAATAAAKAELHRTGAIAVDMESLVVAETAAGHALPFAILRVIGDTATDTLPAAARVPLTPDGDIRLGAILAAVACRLWEIPALIRLAGATATALARLRAASPGTTGD